MSKRILFAALVCLGPSLCQAVELRVLTYNIHHGVGEDSVLNLNRIANVILSANPDIVSLQEVDHDVPRSNNVLQTQRLAELTGMQWYFGKARNLNGGAYGNGVLVRNGIDILDTTNHQLPNPDNVEPRSVIEMNLSVDSNPGTTEFKFFVTHLMHDSSAGRIASAQYINGLVSGSSVPAILAGDMNFNPGSTAFNITTNEWADLTNVNNSGKNRNNQIDYIFYRSSSQWDVVSQSQFIVNATTNVASDHHPLLGVVAIDLWPDSALVWNNNSGSATAFTEGFAIGDGSLSVGQFPASPWNSQFNTGTQKLLVGYNGVATFSGSASRTIGSMSIGTHQAGAVIAGRNGNGTVTASGSVNLVVSSTSESSGDLMVGEGGHSGTIQWNSSGTLEVQGRLRVGHGGIGTFQQTNGVVVGGTMPGTFKFIGIGIDADSTGTYSLDGGFLRPSGGFTGTQFRQTIVGDNSASGTLNVGNDVGAANTAVLESNDDLVVGRNGGTGLVRVRNDGRIELRTNTNQAELIVGQAGHGSIFQTGGTVVSDSVVRIGGNAGGIGSYTISAGSLTTAVDGSGTFQIGHNGGAGTLRVEGTGVVRHGAEMFIGSEPNSGGNGRLEIIGRSASIQVARLDNAAGGAHGLSETIRWVADAGGITPIVIDGASGTNRVKLQDVSELASNTGINGGGNLRGDGTALELDLSAITFSTTLTLLDNRTTDAITGFFEKGATRKLYEEGAVVPGTGFDGTVTISYVGGTGNDVLLTLVAAAGLAGDHNGDGAVDAADYVTWRKTGVGGQQGHVDWRSNFGAESPNLASNLQVPEPGAWILLALGTAAAQLGRHPFFRFERTI